MTKDERRSAAPEIADFVDGIREFDETAKITYAKIGSDYQHGRSWDELDSYEFTAK